MKNYFKSAMHLLIFCMGVIVFLQESGKVYASGETAESLIEEYINATDKQDWKRFTELYCEDEQQTMRDFFNDEYSEIEHLGVCNVKNAELIEAVEIDIEDAVDMLYKDYEKSKTRVFVVGVDYDVFNDCRYYSDGVNYNLVVCVEEENQWKISEMLSIDNPQKLLDVIMRLLRMYGWKAIVAQYLQPTIRLEKKRISHHLKVVGNLSRMVPCGCIRTKKLLPIKAY